MKLRTCAATIFRGRRYRHSSSVKLTSMEPRPLKQRTWEFAQKTRLLLNGFRSNDLIREDCNQLWRSSGSVGANFIEADEAVSTKDFLNCLRICRKETKESWYWLSLLIPHFSKQQLEAARAQIQECRELIKIFTAIEKKIQKKE
jgi:four helix bundle protein